MSLCAKLDIRASYLTIIHGLHKKPFRVSEDHDPYAIEGNAALSCEGVVCSPLRKQGSIQQMAAACG